jgi:hypothetical protein
MPATTVSCERSYSPWRPRFTAERNLSATSTPCSETSHGRLELGALGEGKRDAVDVLRSLLRKVRPTLLPAEPDCALRCSMAPKSFRDGPARRLTLKWSSSSADQTLRRGRSLPRATCEPHAGRQGSPGPWSAEGRRRRPSPCSGVPLLQSVRRPGMTPSSPGLRAPIGKKRAGQWGCGSLTDRLCQGDGLRPTVPMPHEHRPASPSVRPSYE